MEREKKNAPQYVKTLCDEEDYQYIYFKTNKQTIHINQVY